MLGATLPVLLAYVAFVSLGLPDGLLGVSWPSISGDFGVPLEALGLLVAVTTAGYLTSSFLAGVILRLLPIGAVLALSTAAASTALLGFAASPAFPVLVAFGFLAGLGGGAVDAGLNAYGARHFSARTLNWLHAFFGLGTTIGPLIVTAVLNAGLVWRWSYAIVGSAQVLLAATFLLTRRHWLATSPETAEAADGPAAGSFAALRRPVVWLGMLVFFFYTGVELATAQWSYTLLTLGRGMSEATAGLFVTLYWGSLMAGRVLFGFVADLVPLARTLRLCLIAGAFGAALFWLEPTPAVSLVGLMLIGFALRAGLRLADQPDAGAGRARARQRRDRLPDRRRRARRRGVHRLRRGPGRGLRARGDRRGSAWRRAGAPRALRGLHARRPRARAVAPVEVALP